MKLNYNVTGEKRKALASSVSRELNSPVRYLGAPTFAYEVGGYHIDKAGTLTGPDNLDLEDALHQAGFDAEGDSREYDQPDTYESGLGSMGAIDEFIDNEQHHPEQYSNSDAHITNNMQRQMDEIMTVPEPVDGIGLVIEMPRSSFTDTALENLKRLVESKSSLIKKALGVAELPIEVSNETVSFPWFTVGINADETKAYTHFVTALCELAKTQHRVNVTEKAVDNEKFAFRCLLLRLGFIGQEYKAERKVLLSKLTGSSAFKQNNSAAVMEDE